MVERVVWDHEAAGSKPVTRTRKPAEIIRFQRVFYANCSVFEKTLFFDYRGAGFALRIRQSGIVLNLLGCTFLPFGQGVSLVQSSYKISV